MKSNGMEELNSQINKNSKILSISLFEEKSKKLSQFHLIREKKDSPSEIVALHHAIVTYSQKPSFDVESKF